MKLFGDKSSLAIEYNFDENTYGRMGLWINGNNLCTYNNDMYYVGNLYTLIEWFGEKREFILGYDNFPLPVMGYTILELIDNANEYQNENELEFDLWYAAKNRWILNHCWFNAREGSILPCVYFRKIEDCIEISWDNSIWEKYNITFESRRGTYLIKFDIFLKILRKFLVASIMDMEGMEEYKESINSLKKLMF